VSALAEQVHEHARLVAAGQLERANGRLADLGPEQRRAVEDLVVTLAQRIADLLLDEGRRNQLVAAALDSIYSTTAFPPPPEAAATG
jgi:hypothetical protein